MDEEVIKRECRRASRQIWREQPSLTIDEMLARNEIQFACQYNSFSREKLLDWILPDITPHEELTFFQECNVWSIQEAVALWLDMNPFIFIQSFKSSPSFWNQAFHPALRERYHKILDFADRSAIDGSLPTRQKNGIDYVVPVDFYKWAMKHTDGPNGDRPQQFFEMLCKKEVNELSETGQMMVGAADPHSGTEVMGRRNNQVQEILKIAESLGYPPLKIPLGGKEKIRTECLKKLVLFTESSFDHAWKEAKKRKMIEVENSESYRKSI